MKKILFFLICMLTITVVSGCTAANEPYEQVFSPLVMNIPEKINEIIGEPQKTIFEVKNGLIYNEPEYQNIEMVSDFSPKSPIYEYEQLNDNSTELLQEFLEETEGLEDLKAEIEAAITGIDGEWAVYIKNVDTNEYLSINNHPMYSASLIKLFIMNAVYEKLESGELQKTDEIASLLQKMITVSDNDASNRLVEILGGGDFDAGLEVENDCTARYGFPDTKQQCDLQDVRTHPAKGRNYTSVNDCGKLLEGICRKNITSYTASDEMIDLLFGQQVKYKIPAGLPEDAFVANKTGEMTGVQNDAAIVYSPNCLYILCIMSNELTADDSGYNAINKIISISSMVYDYFN